jgi:hypothetical protein
MAKPLLYQGNAGKMIVEFQGQKYELPETEDAKKFVSANARRIHELKQLSNLGLATTEELLLELSARGRVRGDAEGRKLQADVAMILAALPEEMLKYKTVNDD